jgi:hypothetical protein
VTRSGRLVLGRVRQTLRSRAATGAGAAVTLTLFGACPGNPRAHAWPATPVVPGRRSENATDDDDAADDGEHDDHDDQPASESSTP